MTKSNLVLHAEHELSLLTTEQVVEFGLQSEDSVRALLDAVRVFAGEGHSGGSAGCVTGAMDDGVLRTLLRFEPLTPLTGDDEEWFVHGHGDECYAQNKRCSHVFKRRDGTAYDINAVVYRDPDGSCWTAVTESKARPVTFPYVPATEIIDRPAQVA